MIPPAERQNYLRHLESGDPRMPSIFVNYFGKTCKVTAIALAILFAHFARAEEKLSEPIYRVANDQPTVTTTATTAKVPVTPDASATPAPVFDLTQKPKEHPLAPVLRALKVSQEEIDRNLHDYCCNFIKQERIDGELGDQQQILMKVAHDPFSVYMSFIKPYTGREVVYVSGQNEGKMVVLEAGFKRMLGKMNLDPQGSLAMKGQKRPITDVGIRNLTAKLTKMWTQETKFAECEVTSDPNMKAAGRSTTLIKITHPLPRQDFKFHVARLFLDNELKIPIIFDAYLWPEKAGDEPPLEESYLYANLKVNNGYTAREFDTVNNPEIFKK